MNRSEPKHQKSRRLLPVLLLVTVLIAAAVLVLLLPVIEAEVPSKAAGRNGYSPTFRTVGTRDATALVSIAVTHADGSSYTLLYQNGTLVLQAGGDQTEAIRPEYAAKFLRYATEIAVEDTVTDDVAEVEENLPDMGLVPPQIEVLVTYADGTADSLTLGYQLPETSYYYYRWSGDTGVYLCNSGVYETFAYTADMLLPITQPSILASLIEQISIARGDGEPVVCAFTADADGNVLNTLQSPFVYPMDTEAAKALRAAAENFRLGSRLKPVTEDNRAQYGLDHPLAVVTIALREGLFSKIGSDGGYQTYTRPAGSVTLTIGSADGEFFYFCEYEGTCYRVSGILVSAFLGADADHYLTSHPADMGGETMQGVSLQTGGGTLDFAASYTEQVLPNNELATDKSGNVLYTQTVALNGEPMAADAFDSLVERLGQITVSGRLDAPRQPEGAPLWQMTLTTVQGISRTLAAYPLDAFQDVLAVNGVALHSINKEALDIALGEFAALLHAAQPQATE